MLKFINKQLRNEKGFTLVELMVVVVIIGILVAIAVPVYNTSTENAREKACFANQRTIEGAVLMYLADNPDKKIDDVGNMALLVGDDKYIKSDPKCGGESYTLEDGVVKCPNEHHHYSEARSE